MQQAIFYSDAGLNRAAEMRVDKAKLSDAFESPEALVRLSDSNNFLHIFTEDVHLPRFCKLWISRGRDSESCHVC
jgi:hypothetical protein